MRHLAVAALIAAVGAMASPVARAQCDSFFDLDTFDNLNEPDGSGDNWATRNNGNPTIVSSATLQSASGPVTVTPFSGAGMLLAQPWGANFEAQYESEANGQAVIQTDGFSLVDTGNICMAIWLPTGVEVNMLVHTSVATNFNDQWKSLLISEPAPAPGWFMPFANWNEGTGGPIVRDQWHFTCLDFGSAYQAAFDRGDVTAPIDSFTVDHLILHSNDNNYVHNGVNLGAHASASSPYLAIDQFSITSCGQPEGPITPTGDPLPPSCDAAGRVYIPSIGVFAQTACNTVDDPSCTHPLASIDGQDYWGIPEDEEGSFECSA